MQSVINHYTTLNITGINMKTIGEMAGIYKHEIDHRSVVSNPYNTPCLYIRRS